MQFQNGHTFVCHHHLLTSHVRGLLHGANDDLSALAIKGNGEDLMFIDVSEKLTAPTRLPSIPSSLYTFTSTTLRPFTDTLTNPILVIPSIPSCLLALTGWLLEYPTIYVQDSDQDAERCEWDSRGNCLGNVTLTVVRVKLLGGNDGRDHPLLSFSFPSDLVSATEAAGLVRKTEERYAARAAGQQVWVGVGLEVESACLSFVA
ncbi:hypothetical protein BC938DRAFT_472057, partial [Jimgerdemannia flammicorona]